MKKFILPLLIDVLCIGILCGIFYATMFSKPTLIGRYLQTDSGNHLLINEENTIMIMRNVKTNKNIFSGLNDGDQIKITSGDIQESFPPSGDIYNCKLIERGTRADIPQDILDLLIENNWIVE